ncbi:MULTISPECIES: substrate-binding domain-containing protein [unclassified Rhizobium]|uniref:substrate-binding domain-containing protein n=1 Tax=unclassified Rhizobium TaxID=2613769 RepID=UPI00160CADFB|nr:MULTISPECIES: substrate-binding domain-containing protein [unclassified Rhizobium]MBB3318137.1 ribose transport system substrate-binding protein [Rhizobium sp. BK181]MBB3544765.1 ribose transport system substrate-binding protein [Rhizobium sp. BK399]MCS3743334.1 ribose transport system substrate-binding protein [Rhizobium sp. BK661]MCS4096484.1 ribose transport system substrate-binding protein [Rhizobium sp. BK176]
MAITGLGPHGERASAPERVLLLPEDMERARASGLRVAIVLHTLESDWAKQQLSGIVGTLGNCGVAVIDVVDCAFDPEAQIEALERLILEAPDAIISLPVANSKVAAPHARVSAAGIKLVLLDNVPTGLLPGKDYVSLISADNFGLGKIAAEGLSPHLPEGAEVGVLGYDADFFATNEREIAFVKWMQVNRPDVSLHVRRFPALSAVAATTRALAETHPELAGLFVVWDTPAMTAARILEVMGRKISMATVDLGQEATIGLAANEPLVAIAAQQPFRQGETAASITVTALLDRLAPAWVALPGLAVTARNVVESFQTVWRMPAPHEVLRKLSLVGLKRSDRPLP